MNALSKDGAGAVLSWEDMPSTNTQQAVGSSAPSLPVNGLPPEAAQLANYLHMANAFLQNPTVAVLAKYAAHPDALVNGMPNMNLAMQMKQELAALATSSQPDRIRIRCHECGTVNTIQPRGE